MALSGILNASQNAGAMIRLALLKLGVIHPEQPIQVATNNLMLDILNMMIQHFQMQGAHLWTQKEGVVLFNNAVASYTFADDTLSGGSTGVCRADVLATTNTSQAQLVGDTAIHVVSSAGISVGDIICLVQDDNSRLDTAVANVNSSSLITITAPLTSTMASGNVIYSYPGSNTTEANLFYPRQLINVRLRDSTGFERFLTPMSRGDYYHRPDQSLAGSPISYYVDDQLENKVIYFYPVPTDLTEQVRLTYMKALDNVAVLTNDIEFPLEWTQTIVANLTARAAPYFGKDSSLYEVEAAVLLQDALDWDTESVNIQISPDFDY